ncbi:NAD(P)/FAD-dependent oxidoreductase [Piscinibacter sakaiensis]|uniref:NADH dehydrogenase n=1 Tax=Piscinibacter sakaiensis TaxID=1547922 RepID=A0A0K8P5H2_PISS1|nr:FAD-dependent oxidoreductase [Piscinibacter sakaiensis]GAP37958.1 NADH dehydrogenase [Piscinibacter sakaiensis]
MDTSSIVIVGGGAGGLELASTLGRRLGPERVTLVDAGLTHIWKPSLHEVAAGTLDIHQEGLSYQMLAHDNGFGFVYGRFAALDPGARRIEVAPILDEHGEELLPTRTLGYGSLVLAIGSVANHFGVPGAAEHSISLDGPADAEHFRLRMLRLLAMTELRKASDPAAGLDIVIIGGGATGVELAAELRQASAVHAHYGFRRIDAARDVRLTLLEGAPRILAPLPEEVSAAAARLLAERQVRVVTGCRVARIDAREVADAEGRRYPADLCVWAAGIQAPPLLAALGLPVTRQGQVQVDAQLRVPGWAGVYALGDCAACPQPDGRLVPPRAQSAHQQASYLAAAALRAARGQPPDDAPYRYRDHGSLVSLGRRSSVGSLMGSLFGSSRWFVDGLLARWMYASLHLMHHRAVLGTLRTAVLALARFLVKRATPLVKLH